MIFASYTPSSIILTAGDEAEISQLVLILKQIAAMPPSSIALLIRNADNTQGVQELPLNNAGNFQFTVDSSGNVTMTVAPTVTPIHTNDLTLDATAVVGSTKQITFATPMPDVNYTIIPQMNGLAGSLAVVPGSQTVNGYSVKVVALVVGTVTLVAVHKG